MNQKLLSHGIKAIPVILSSFARLLYNLGIGGAIGFSRGVLQLQNKDKQIAENFLRSLDSNNSQNIPTTAINQTTQFFTPNKQHSSLQEIESFFDGRFEIGKTLVSGYAISCSYAFTPNTSNNEKTAPQHQGVALFEINPVQKQITSVHFYHSP